MNRDFISVYSAAPELRLGDCLVNADFIADLMEQAASRGAAVLALPRLALTGASCGDLFYQDTLCQDAEDALNHLLEQTENLELLALVGLPVLKAGRLYEAVAAICGGELLAVLPQRSREPFCNPPEGRDSIRLCGREVPFGASILLKSSRWEQLTVGVDSGALRDPVPLTARLAAGGANVVICPLSVYESLTGPEERRAAALALSARHRIALVCSAAGVGETVTDGVCGGQQLICEAGELLAESGIFSGEAARAEIDVRYLRHLRRRDPVWENAGCPEAEFPLAPSEGLDRVFPQLPWLPREDQAAACSRILDIQANALARRIAQIGAKTLVVGISGGLDSAQALLAGVLAMDLLGRDRTDVLAVTMPGFGTTGRTKGNAELLCERLGVTLKTVNICAAVRQHFRDIGQEEGCCDITYENAQARERTQILMDLANRTGGMVLGTGDLSELALGWATYNGDHMSMYGVNAGLPKTVIRAVLHSASLDCDDDQLAMVLEDILDTPVSPELLPADEEGAIAQKTEDLVGPYELHDFFLWGLLVRGWGPGTCCEAACRSFEGRFDRAVILYWLRSFCRRFFSQQFKRNCLPEGPAVFGVSLSPRNGLRMPSDLLAAAWLREIDRLI